jgi:ankyrin repeat protein
LAEVQDLLDRGVPVDTADTEGDTALMKSIKADRPAAAALLRRNGASLDRPNRAGQSARDMAEGADDPALREAAGLAPP